MVDKPLIMSLAITCYYVFSGPVEVGPPVDLCRASWIVPRLVAHLQIPTSPPALLLLSCPARFPHLPFDAPQFNNCSKFHTANF